MTSSMFQLILMAVVTAATPLILAAIGELVTERAGVLTLGVEGMTEPESQNLLAFLYGHMLQEQFVYRHVWRPDMLILWDNRCCLHNATGGYDGHRRVMHRTTVAGEVPISARQH